MAARVLKLPAAAECRVAMGNDAARVAPMVIACAESIGDLSANFLDSRCWPLQRLYSGVQQFLAKSFLEVSFDRT